jgi:hypothetical protein
MARLTMNRKPIRRRLASPLNSPEPAAQPDPFDSEPSNAIRQRFQPVQVNPDVQRRQYSDVPRKVRPLAVAPNDRCGRSE